MAIAFSLTRRIPAAPLASGSRAALRPSICSTPAVRYPLTNCAAASPASGRSSVVLTDRIDDAVLDAAPELKVVANIAVGYDNIDVAAAKARGVVVTNTPDVLTEASAELTWGLILAAARRIGEGERLVRRGGWKGWALDFMLGTELRGKQLGIIGRGRIGRAVAAKAAGLRHAAGSRARSPTRSRRAVARRAAGQLRRHLHPHAAATPRRTGT